MTGRGVFRLCAGLGWPVRLGLLASGIAVLGLGLFLPASSEDTATATARAIDIEAVQLRVGDAQSLAGLGRLEFRRLEHLLARIDDASDACLKAGTVDRRSAQKAELSRLFAILSKSPTAQSLLDRAWRHDVYVCADPGTGLLAYYLSGLRLIGLNPALTEGQKLAFLAHELAHMPQHPLYSDNRHFPPDDLVLLRRVREAAAEACATQIAWELKQAGLPAAWNAKYADRFYGDIARAYTGELDPRASDEGQHRAMRAAFDQWFDARARRDLYDRMTVDHLERFSGDAVGLVPPRRRLSHEFLLGIATLGGRNYLASAPGRRLTDTFYAGRLSSDNAGLLRDALREAGVSFETQAGAADQHPDDAPAG